MLTNLSVIKYAKTFKAQAHGKPQETVVKITCYFSDFTGEIQPAAEIEEVAWLNHVNKSKSSLVTQLIMDWLKSKKIIN